PPPFRPKSPRSRPFKTFASSRLHLAISPSPNPRPRQTLGALSDPMGAAPSTPRLGEAGAASPGAAEQMFAALVGDRAYPISSEFWRQLLELPLTQQWPRDRVLQACHAFGKDPMARDPRHASPLRLL
uniref:Uncharacterized protein n=2 Tax=Aegilops tauschii subsp. strangulata TaxID=200361 RepID=A0A453FMJ2_AEGTS